MRWIVKDGEVWVSGNDVAKWLDVSAGRAYEKYAFASAGRELAVLANNLRAWLLDRKAK